jgi:hypothetical protein
MRRGFGDVVRVYLARSYTSLFVINEYFLDEELLSFFAVYSNK